MLPKPHTFVDENYIETGELRRVMRTNSIQTAMVVGVASLRDDGTFTFDVQNPKNKNVWFIVTVITYEGRRHELAVNGDGFYELAAGNRLRIALNPYCSDRSWNRLRLTTLDKQLIQRAIEIK